MSIQSRHLLAIGIGATALLVGAVLMALLFPKSNLEPAVATTSRSDEPGLRLIEQEDIEDIKEPSRTHESAGPSKGAVETSIPTPSSEVPNDAPYGTGMRRGSSRLALTRDVPLEWIRECLEAVESVEALTVKSSLLTPEILALIGEIGNVKHMSFLDVMELGSSAGEALGNLSGVESVALDSPMPVLTTGSTEGEAAFNAVAELFLAMPDASSFESHGEMCVNDGFLRVISRSTRIRRLSLRNYPDLRRARQVSTAGLLEIAKLAQLRELRMANFTIQNHEIDLSQLAYLLSQLPLLERLDLSGWDVQDGHLSQCDGTLSRLRYLNLSGTRISDDFYLKFGRTWSMEELVTSNLFGDRAAAAVAALPKLRVLDASGSKVGDQGLSALGQGATYLEEINLRACNTVTNAGVTSLRLFPALTRVHLSGISGLGRESIVGLAASHPVKVLGISELEFVSVEFIDELIRQAPDVETLYLWRCRNLSKDDRKRLAETHPAIAFRNAPYAYSPR